MFIDAGKQLGWQVDFATANCNTYYLETAVLPTAAIKTYSLHPVMESVKVNPKNIKLYICLAAIKDLVFRMNDVGTLRTSLADSCLTTMDG